MSGVDAMLGKKEVNVRTNLPQHEVARLVGDVAEEQAGVISLKQALAEGIRRSDARKLFDTGAWLRSAPGVYRTFGSPKNWQQNLWTACLETDGVASHRTAGYLWKLDGLPWGPPEKLEILIRHGNRRLSDFATVRRSRSLCDHHIYKGDGIPRTNVPRTLIDLADVMEQKPFEEAFDSALRLVDDLRSWLRRLLAEIPRSRQQRRGRAMLEELVGDTRPPLDSALEVKIRQLFAEHGIPEARTGYPTEDDNGFQVKLDFAWPDRSPPVGLLAHGKRFHLKEHKWDNDIDQTSGLSVMRWTVLQCTYKQVTKNPTLFIRRIRRALGLLPLP